MVLYRSPDLRVIKEPLQIIFAYYRRIRKSYPAPGGHVFWHIIIPWKKLVEGYQRIFSVKLIWNWTIGFGVEDFHSFLYSHIRKTGPAHGRHVYWHIIILWATLVKVYPRIVSVKFFWNWTSSFGEEDFQSIYKENWPTPGGHDFLNIIILWTSLVEVYQRIISVKLFWNWTISFREEDFQSFLYSHIRKTGPAPGSHVFCHIIIFWTALVEVHPRIISVKLIWNWTNCLWENYGD